MRPDELERRLQERLDALGPAPRTEREAYPPVGMSERFDHGHEPRAEEIALHQRFLTLLDHVEAAESEGDEQEVRRLRPVLERARRRWLAANLRITRGG